MDIITHATELVLDRPAFFWQSYHLLDNSSSHVADLNVLNILRLNSNPPRRITSMEVNHLDLDAFDSATRAQLPARELGKFQALIPIFGRTILSLSRWKIEPRKCSTRMSMQRIISRAV